MSPPINPRHLLEHAQDLVDHRRGPGRPRAILLRRAVSSAYYALFHGLAMRTGRPVLPHGTLEEQLGLCRSIDHGRLTDVCAWVGGQPGSGKQHVRKLIGRARANADLVHVADVVVQLQEARHDADYDHLHAPDKAAASSSVAQARSAMDALDRHAASPDLAALLAVIAMHAQLR